MKQLRKHWRFRWKRQQPAENVKHHVLNLKADGKDQVLHVKADGKDQVLHVLKSRRQRLARCCM